MASQSGILQGNFAGIPSILTLPSVRSEVVDLYRRQKFIDLLKWLGVWRKVEDDKFYSVRSQNEFYSLDTTSATVTGSASATVTITGLVTAQSGKAIVGDTMQLPNGLFARVQSVTPVAGLDTVVLQSFAAGTPNLTLVAGNVVRQVSNAQEEGSEAPTSRIIGMDTIYNHLGIFRKSFTATDVQKMKQGRRLLVNVDGKETAFGIGMIQKYLQHRAEVASGLLLHPLSDPNFSNASPTVTGINTRGVQTGRGLIPTINTYGSAVAVTTSGSPVTADWEALIVKMAQVDGPDRYALIGSTAAIMRASSSLKALGSANTSPVRIFLDADQTHINFTVEEVTWGDKQLSLVSMDSFDAPEIMPVASADYKTIWCIPMGEYPTVSASGEAKGSNPYLGVVYGAIDEPGIGNEMEAEVRFGALAPNGGTNGTNVDQTTWCSAVALETPKPEAFIKLTGVLA